MESERLRITLVEKKNREWWPEANCRKNLPSVTGIVLDHGCAERRKGGRADRLERNKNGK